MLTGSLRSLETLVQRSCLLYALSSVTTSWPLCSEEKYIAHVRGKCWTKQRVVESLVKPHERGSSPLCQTPQNGVIVPVGVGGHSNESFAGKAGQWYVSHSVFSVHFPGKAGQQCVSHLVLSVCFQSTAQ